LREKNVNNSVNVNEPSILIYLDVNRLPADLGLFLKALKEYISTVFSLTLC